MIKKSNRLLPQMRQDSLDAMYFARSHANWFYDIEEKSEFAINGIIV